MSNDEKNRRRRRARARPPDAKRALIEELEPRVLLSTLTLDGAALDAALQGAIAAEQQLIDESAALAETTADASETPPDSGASADSAADAALPDDTAQPDPSATDADDGSTDPAGAVGSEALALPLAFEENLGASIEAAREIVFVDAAVPDASQLIDSLLASRPEGTQFEVVVLQPGSDGLRQIGDALARETNLAALHIVSHGGPGVLRLGSTAVDASTLLAQSAELGAWSQALADDADILLYGCDVAAGDEGAAFIAQLARATGADVAASDDATGHESLGGDWLLEASTGAIDTDIVFDAPFRESWVALLPTYQQFTSFPDEVEIKSDSNRGQTFVHTSGSGTYAVNQLSLAMRADADASAQTLTVTLRSGGWNGTVLGTATVASSSLGTSLAFVDLAIPDVTLTDGVTYTLRVTSNTTSGKVYAGFNSSGGYANGTMIDVNGSPLSGEDVAFKVGYVAPASFVVTNTNDSGAGSLRQAILDANTSPGNNSITFAIPGVGVQTISPTSALPTISDGVTIDATTQPGFAGTPLVRIDGASAGAAVDGLRFASTSDGSTVRGLMITRFTRDGIAVQSGADDITIAGNWIGTTGTGSTGVGNADDGIDLAGSLAVIGGTGANDRNVITNSGDEGIDIVGSGVTAHVIQGNTIGLDPDGSSGGGNADVGIAIISGSGNTIGGTTPAARNVISRNYEGIEINTSNNVVQGNYIGTDATGSLNRGNRSDDGVEIQGGASGNLIGGELAGAGNVIAFNALNGVNVVSGTGNAIVRNSIHSNTLLGIDLGTAGVTANDLAASMDSDGGANNLQNFPVLFVASSTGGNTTISGSLNSTASTTFRIEFFSSTTGDASGYGEAQTYLGATTVTTDASGNASFATTLTGVSVASGQAVTATATVDLGGGSFGSTSEFAANLLANNSAQVAAGEDTYLQLKNTGLNYGASTSLVIDRETTDLQRALLDFDLSAIPANATITSATLVMQATQVGGTLNISVYEMLSSWVEGAGSGTADASNWNQRAPGTSWSSAGGDFNPTAVANLNTNSTGQHSWNVTSLVQAWVDGSKTNNGLMVASPDGGGNRTATYDSSEGTTPPRLVISYTVSPNTAPSLDTSKNPVLTAVAEDAGAPVGAVGTLVSSLVDFASPAGQVDNVTDADGGAQLGIAVTAADATNGTWWYSTNNGGSWTALGTVSASSARLLAADAGTRLYFQPNANYNGALASAITFRAWDRTSGANGTLADTSLSGGTTAFSTASDTASLVISAVNDAPVNTVPGPQVTPINQSLAFSGANAISVADLDANSSPLQVTLTATNGRATMASTVGLSFSSGDGTNDASMTFQGTLSSINAALAGLTFSPTPSYSGAASLQITTNDLAGRTVGNTTVLGSTSAPGAFDKEQIATQVSVSSSGTLTSVTAFLINSKTNDVHYGIYSDVAGEPGTLLAQASASLPKDLVGSWYTLELPSTALTAGTYWIALDVGKDGAYSYNATGGNTRFSNYDPKTGLSSPSWTGTYASNTQALSAYLAFTTTGDTPLTDTDIINITVGANTAPVLTGANALTAINEDPTSNGGTLVSALLAGHATDPDANSLSGIAVTAVDNTNGSWEYTTDAGGAWTAFGSPTANAARLLAANSSSYVRFVPNPNWNGTVASGLTFRAWDQTSGTPGGTADTTLNGGNTAFSINTAASSITVNPVNDAPTLGSGALAAVSEDTLSPAGQTVSAIFTGQFGDIDAGSSLGGIAVAGNTADAGTQGTWQYSTNAGGNWFAIGAVSDGATALAVSSSTLIRFVPVANYNGAPPALVVRGLDNSYASGFSTTASIETRVSVDTTSTGGTTAVAAVTANLSTSITPVNDAPVLTGANDLGPINEDTPNSGMFVSSLIAGHVSDPDSGALVGIAVTAVDNSNGTWQYSTDGAFSWNDFGSPSTTAARLLGTDPNSGVRFVPNANWNGTVTTGLTFRAWDQTSGTPGGTADTTTNGGSSAFSANTAASSITVTAVNDAPVHSVPGPQNTFEDTALVFSSGNGNPISISDVDAGAASVNVMLSVTDGALTLNGTGGLSFISGDGSADSLMNFTGSVASINAALNGLTFTPSPDFRGGVTLQIVTGDMGNTGGGALTDSDTVSITVDAVNDAPVITSHGGGASASLSVAENTTLVTTVGASDVDLPAQTLTYSIVGGADQARFTIDGATGALSFNQAPNFEAPGDADADNVYQVTVRVSDGAGGSDTQAIAITVSDVADGIRVTPISVGPIGGEIRVNTTTADAQLINPNVAQAIASDANGNFVVVWTSNLQDGALYGIYAQRFSADGTAQGAEFLVNATSADNQINPVVAMDAAGNFVVSWASNLQDGSGYGVYAQRFSAGGVAQGAEFLVNTTTSGSQGGPAIAMAPSGAFVIAWTGSAQDPDATAGIYAQRFDASGVAQGSEFRVNTYTSATQQLPSVAMDAAGDFVVSWVSDGQDGSGYGVYAQRFDASGLTQGAEFRINTTTADSQLYHDVVMLADGRFAVAFQSRSGASFEVYLQRYTADGAALGSETRVNTTTVTGMQPIPSITADASGNLTLVWNSSADGDGAGVIARRLDWSGTPLGGEFQVNATSAGNQSYPEVVAQPGGGFLAAWSGNGPGDADGVFLQRYGLATTEAGGTATFQVVLEAAPTADVTITLTNGDPSEGALSTSTLTFTTANWNIAQTVTVAGVDDGLDDGDIVYRIMTNAASSADANFNGLDAADVVLTNLDDDEPPLLDLDADDSSGAGGADFVATWTENAGPVALVDTDAALTDAGGTTLNSLAVQITNLLDGPNELLLADVSGTSITATYNAATGVLSLTGVDTIAHYQQVLRTIAYDNSSNAPDTTARVITFQAFDPSLASNLATTTLTMVAVNDAPVASDDSAALNEGASSTIDLAANDSDADSALDLASIQIVSGPANGSVVVNADGTVSYTHDGSETVADAFTYTIRDISGAISNVATVTLTVNPVNDAPVASDDSAALNEGASSTIDLAANDSDVDDALDLASIQIVSGPANGSVVVNADGTVSYTHDGSQTAADAFTYTIRDASGAISNVATVTLTVNPVNDAPVASDDSAALNEGASSGIDLAANDSDADNALDLTSIQIVSGPANGSVVVNADGTVTYTHDGSETVADAFTYTIRDASGAISNVANVTLTVNSVNDAPVASDDSATLAEGASSTFSLAANDSDADDALDLASIQIVSGPANGSVVVNGDGTVSYTHDGSETIADAFTYTIRDASGAISSVATVTLTVNPVNDAPVASADSGTANEGGVTTVNLAANDSDADDGLGLSSIQIVSGPANGTVLVNGDGTVSYTHDGSETAADAFTYTIRDASGAISNVATVTLTVNPVNDAPVAAGDSATLSEGASSTIDLAANDIDADNALDLTSIQIVSGPASGSVVVNADGTVSYTHDGSETVADAFTYTIRDASGAISNVATVTLTVNPVNDAPIANADAGTANEGGATTVDLAANDSDADSAFDLASIQIVSGPASGSVVVNPNGTVTYTHDGSETAADAFTYTIRDASGAISNVATVTLTVNPVNDAPVANNDGAALNEGASSAIDLAADDTDADDALDLASIQIVSGPANGSVVVNPDGTVSYTHDGSETVADAFTYTIRDASGAISNVATVTLTVNAVNDAPVASNDVAALSEGASSTIDLAANDSDADNALDLTSIQIVSGPANGSVVVNADGTVNYTHDGSGTVADAFTYTIRDASGAISSVAIVTLTVNPVNDAPVANADSGTANEGGATTVDLAANDSDADNALDLTSIQIVSGPTNGSVVVNADGTVSYTHDGSETAADAFTYTIRDVSGAISNVATVTLTVNPVNDAPIAAGDSATLNEGASSTIDLAANDSDADNALDLTSIQIVSGPARGSVVVNADGTVSYTHDGSETGADAFTYTIRDASGAISNVATVTLTVNAVNDAPVASDDSATLSEGASSTIDLAANDSDADNALDLTSIQIVSGPANGSVLVNADGTVAYTHNGSETTADAFTYTIRDASGAISNVATVTLTVNPVNDAPVANNDAATLAEGASSTFSLAANDSDADNALDLTSIQIVSGPANGSILVNADGTVAYTHNGSETTADAFTYTIRDASGTISNVATVTLTVNPVNDAPVAGDDSATLNEGASSTIDLAANDSDADNALDLTSIQIVSGPANGSIVVNADGTVSYTHDGSETVADAFTYTIRDASGAISNVATVTLTVNPVNDAPVANNDAATLDEGASSTFSLAANDSDADNALDLTSIQIVSSPANGSVVVNADGTVTFTHDGSETVADAFTYTIRDVSGAISSIATVTLTVNPVNDAPLITSGGGSSTAALSVAENSISVTQVSASDVDVPAQALSYSIVGGADAARFTIDASTGELSFATAPDYEAPGDFDADNVYDVIVQASDGALADTQALAVTVRDVDSTLVVTTTADTNDAGIVAGNAAHTSEWLAVNRGADGLVSLREAIIAANNTANAGSADVITFDIPGGGPHTIVLGSALPAITDAVVLDASSEPDFSPGTAAIVVDGSFAGSGANGLVLASGSDGSTLRGFAIHGFDGSGIVVQSAGNLLDANFIGTDATGAIALGNAANGVFLAGGDNRVIGNVIAGNALDGVVISGPAAASNVLWSNWIGVDDTGAVLLGNGQSGVFIDQGASNNSIGGTGAGEGNLIAGHGGSGIAIAATSSDRNALLGNLIWSNAQLGIDLGDDGRSDNDALDADSGANQGQNFPLLSAATSDGAGSILIAGDLDSAPGTTYRVEFFANAVGDNGNHGEAERYLGFVNVTTDASGYAAFAASLSAMVGVGEVVTATATDSAGNTSEFALNRVVDAPTPSLDLDADDSSGVGGTSYQTTWTEGAGAVSVADSDLAISDLDSATLVGATVAITNPNDGALESLTASTAGTSITASYDAGTGILTLSGVDTLANYELVLRSVAYDNASNAPDPAVRVVQVSVNDGSYWSNVATADVAILATNDAPLAGDDAMLANEAASTPIDLAANDTDADDALDLSSIQIVSGPASGSVVVNADGTVSYTHDGSETVADAFSYTIRDASGTISNVATVTLVVSPVNDAPLLLANTLAITRGGAVVLSGAALAASDAETAANGLTFTVSGVAHGSFEHVGAPGVAVASFTQAELAAGQIRFVHDGTNSAPTYNVSVGDGTSTVGPFAAAISLDLGALRNDPGDAPSQVGNPSDDSMSGPGDSGPSGEDGGAPGANDAVSAPGSGLSAPLGTERPGIAHFVSRASGAHQARLVEIVRRAELDLARLPEADRRVVELTHTTAIRAHAALWASLDRLRSEMTERGREATELADWRVNAIELVGLAFSSGVLLTMLRSSSLWAAALSSLPLWRRLDPLVVLAINEDQRRRLRAELRRASAEEDRRRVGRVLDANDEETHGGPGAAGPEPEPTH